MNEMVNKFNIVIMVLDINEMVNKFNIVIMVQCNSILLNFHTVSALDVRGHLCFVSSSHTIVVFCIFLL